jgi:hypothetical protein
LLKLEMAAVERRWRAGSSRPIAQDRLRSMAMILPASLHRIEARD